MASELELHTFVSVLLNEFCQYSSRKILNKNHDLRELIQERAIPLLVKELSAFGFDIKEDKQVQFDFLFNLLMELKIPYFGEKMKVKFKIKKERICRFQGIAKSIASHLVSIIRGEEENLVFKKVLKPSDFTRGSVYVPKRQHILVLQGALEVTDPYGEHLIVEVVRRKDTEQEELYLHGDFHSRYLLPYGEAGDVLQIWREDGNYKILLLKKKVCSEPYLFPKHISYGSNVPEGDSATKDAREKELKKLEAEQKKEAAKLMKSERKNMKSGAEEENQDNYVDPVTSPGEKKKLSPQMAKTFSPSLVEKSWHAWWEKSGFYVADASSSKPPFMITEVSKYIEEFDFNNPKHSRPREFQTVPKLGENSGGNFKPCDEMVSPTERGCSCGEELAPVTVREASPREESPTVEVAQIFSFPCDDVYPFLYEDWSELSDVDDDQG